MGEHDERRREAREILNEWGAELDKGSELGAREPLAGLIRRLESRGDDDDRYILQGEIGRGGMAAILRVWDNELCRTLAMKVIADKEDGGTTQVDANSLARFLGEAQITGQLDHPGIVPVHELGLDSKGRVFFTMRMVKGLDLKAIFDKVRTGEEGWTQTRAVGVLLKVCEAMAYAHSKGVIHRDLKPANIMVGRFGEVYVMDWGLAKTLGEEDPRDLRLREHDQSSAHMVVSTRSGSTRPDDEPPLITMDGAVIGTPAYMSPEQAKGDLDKMDPRSDVYSLGAILYQLLAGRAPYCLPEGLTPARAVWMRVLEGELEAIESLHAEAPPELIAICKKAMARRPELRYADTLELSDDLRSYLEGHVVRAYETGAVAELRKWMGRNRALAAALAAGLLALVSGLVISLGLKGRADRNFALAENGRKETAAALALAEERRQRSEESLALAEERRVEAETRRDEVLRLSALQELDELAALASRAWPSHPEQIEAYEEWIAAARELIAALPVHQRKRAELLALARPKTDEERRAERESHPRYVELLRLEEELAFRDSVLTHRRYGVEPELPDVDWTAYPEDAADLRVLAREYVKLGRSRYGREALGLVLARRATQSAAADALTLKTLADASVELGFDAAALEAAGAAVEVAVGAERARFEEHLASLQARVAEATSEAGMARDAEILADLDERRTALTELVSAQREWDFPEDARESLWWSQQITKLILRLRELENTLLAEDSVTPALGWSVPKRLAFAERLRDGYAPGGEFAAAWDEAAEGIRATYPGLDLKPQIGLVPIGPDPDSKLWEFAHLQTGEVPQRDASGALVLTEASGLVFVLLPGGPFTMGAQSRAAEGPNYDAAAIEDEGPVHEVFLSPFFLSKYEMNQGQWSRFAGVNPSYYQQTEFTPTLLHPVEQVSWVDCVNLFTQLGLALPSEAQWEYAARGGTTSAWWTGDTVESLAGAANLADRTAAQSGVTWGIETWAPFEDGYIVHAPVDAYRPNPFGMHNILGNVNEWCYDTFELTTYGTSFGSDPVADYPESPLRVFRGGSYNVLPFFNRSAVRFYSMTIDADLALGVRPARAVQE